MSTETQQYDQFVDSSPQGSLFHKSWWLDAAAPNKYTILTVKNSDKIIELHRVSGDGCYWLKAVASNHEELNKLLDEILMYGNYKSSISTARIK
jgi:hypothetical protein